MALSGCTREAFSSLCRACARSLPLSASRPRRNSSSKDWAASAPATTHSRNAKDRVMQPHCRTKKGTDAFSAKRLENASVPFLRIVGLAGGSACPTVLEPHPERELDMPLRPRLGTGDGAEIRVLHVVVRSAELRRVEQIRRFEAEFGPEPLGEREVLENREIQGLGGRRRVALQPQVTFRKAVVGHHGGSVKPLAGRAATGGSILGVLAGNQIGEATGPDADATVGAQGKRISGVHRENAVELPIAEYGADWLAEAVAEFLAVSKGNIVREAANQIVANVPCRGGIRQVDVRIVGVAKAAGTTERSARVGQGVPIGVCDHEHQAGG